MKKKMFALSLIVLSMMLYASLANAQLQEVTVWPNKTEYAPGEKGTLNVVFYNDRNDAVAIKNVTILYYSWMAYVDGAWVGNVTYTMDVPISGKSTKLINDVVDITFTVPTDGRAVDTSVKVEIGTDKGFEYGYASINLQEPTPKYMEQIATLFTIQVVLLIVCTIIIAATIFLSARRPSLVWKAEEKAE